MNINRTINKVVNKSTMNNDETLLDLTNDTVQEENLLLNETAHNREGDPVTGGMVPITNYEQLTGKPKINNVELTGNKTSSDLSLVGTAEKGQINGVASLNESGKVPSDQLPSFVDDTIEGYLYEGAFYEDAEHTELITGESGKIYVDLVSNHSFRWSGSAYVDITDPDVENSIVHSIADSQDSYPVLTNGETIKVIIGKIKKYLSDLKTDKLDKTGEGKDVIVTYANEGTDSEITSGTKLSKIIAQIAYKFANYKFGHVIKNSSGAVTQRDTLKFTGNVTVTDDSENSQTVVNITGSGGSGVTSFNGRTGAVTPANGDYTAAQVGAIATSNIDTTGTYITDNTKVISAKNFANLKSATSAKRYNIPYNSGWSQVSVDGTTYYRYTLNLTYATGGVPRVDIAEGSSVIPTESEKTAWNLIEYVTVDNSTYQTVYLYAKTQPTSSFYVRVWGCGGEM